MNDSFDDMISTGSIHDSQEGRLDNDWAGIGVILEASTGMIVCKVAFAMISTSCFILMSLTPNHVHSCFFLRAVTVM